MTTGTFMYRGLARTALVLLCLGLLAACAGMPKRSKQPVALEERAQVRWDHLISGNWDEAYTYLTPGVREATNVDGYKSRLAFSQVAWTAAAVEESNCESEDRCTVNVKVHFDLRGGLPGVPHLSSMHLVRETWLKLDGTWYYLPSRGVQ